MVGRETDVNEAETALRSWFKAAVAWNELVYNQKPVSQDLTSEVARKAAIFLLAYKLPSNWSNDKTPVVPFPMQLADDISRNIRLILAGHIPNWMLQLQRQGAPSSDPRMLEDIGLALAYKICCEQGLILDKSPTKTIAELYKVSRKQVQNWSKKYPADPLLWFPQAIDEEERAKLIAAKLPIAANRYKTWGRAPNNDRPLGKAGRRRRAKH